MLKVVAGLALIGTAIAPLSAQDAPAEPVKSKKVCRSSADTGSRLSKRTCKTKEEWAAVDAGVSQSVKDLRQSSSYNSSGR